jgi:hypothetical protein
MRIHCLQHVPFEDTGCIRAWEESAGHSATAARFYRSAACENQALIYREHVFGFQFHPETTPHSLRGLIGNCGNEIVAGPLFKNPMLCRPTQIVSDRLIDR